LTRSCERFLRTAYNRVPKGATSLRVNIIGVRGKVNRTIVISGKRARGPVAAQSVVVRRGVPRTTVIFSFNR